MIIWWMRRDLRLHDNTALCHALSLSSQVIPVFILDPAALESRYHREANARRAFLFANLRALEADLRARGSRLVVRAGPPFEALSALMETTGATHIVAEADFSPFARRRDAALAEALPLTLTGGVTVHHPGAVLKPNGTPYVVFTPFSKAWRALSWPTASHLQSAPAQLAAVPEHLTSQPIPNDLPAPAHFPAGEAEAQRRLEAFARQAIFAYDEGRNRLDQHGTSTLSPYLRFGVLSARQALVTARAAHAAAPDETTRKGADTWLNELIWREFYIGVLYHFPHVLRQEFNPTLRNIPWRTAPADLAAWQQGLTGFPVVDACMRQLATTGWMHNRGRMIVASFLVKDLLLDWRLGEAWFMRHLVDGDPAANNGGWQWTAGTGTDAAPYFRIFNPVTQGEKFDPHGSFIRRYVPELARVPDKFIHTPWLMSPVDQRLTGCVLGEHYPRPMVDRSEARQRTLKAYQHSRGIVDSG